MHTCIQRRTSTSLLATTLLAVLAASQQANATIIIDRFNTSQNANISDIEPSHLAVTYSPNGIATAAIGGFRKMASHVTQGGDGDQFRFRVQSSSGLASIATDALVRGKGLITYNGTASRNSGVAAGRFNAPADFLLGSGGGGAPLNALSGGTGIILSGYADNLGIPVIFTFWYNQTRYARGVLRLPGSNNSAIALHYLPFSSFIGQGGLASDILQDVRAITVEIDGTAAGITTGTDVVLDYLVVDQSTAIPEPGTYLLLGSAFLAAGFIRRARIR